MIEKCWVCGKGVYAADPKIMLNGNIHKKCAKCNECGLKLTSSDAFVVSMGDKKILLCPTHNKTALKATSMAAPRAAPLDTGDIMSAEMRSALAQASKAAPAPASDPAPAPAPAPKPPSAPTQASDSTHAASTEKSPKAPAPPGGGEMSTREKAAMAAANLSDTDKGIDGLVEDLQTKEGIEQLRAIAYLADKTGTAEERKSMAKGSVGLLKTLAKVIRGENFDCRLGAIGIVWKLSIEEDNRLEIIKPDVCLLDAIMFALQDGDRPEAKSKALGAMHNLTLAAETQEAVGANGDWLRVFVDLLHHESLDIKDRSIGVLWNLATLASNRVQLVNTPDLLPVVSCLLMELNTGGVDISGKALVVLYYLTLAQESRVQIAAAEGLLPNVVSYLKHPELSDDSKFKLASILINLSSAPENKKLLGAPDLGLLEVLVSIVRDGTNIDLKNKSCGCLWNLSVAAENRQYLASNEVGLLSALMKTLSESLENSSENPSEIKSFDEVVTKTCVIIQNLAGDSANHTIMVDPELKLIETLSKIILIKTGDVKMKAFGAIVNLSLSQNTQAIIGGAEGCSKHYCLYSQTKKRVTTARVPQVFCKILLWMQVIASRWVAKRT